jgi:hypothetical protein
MGSCFFTAYQTTYALESPLIPTQLIGAVAKPYIMYGIAYSVLLLVSLYLNYKKKYFTSIVLTSCLMLFYLSTIFLIGFGWLG